MRIAPWFLTIAAGVGILATPRPLAPQSQPKPKPSLHGVVVDSSRQPIEGADLELMGERRRTVSRSDGSFAFDELRATRYWLMIRRIGYFPVQLSLTLQREEARDLRVVMAQHPFQLPDVVVNAQETNYRARMREFIWRSRSSFGGRFLTADDIARQPVQELAHLVIRYLPFKMIYTLSQPGGWGETSFQFDEDRSSLTRLAGRPRYRPHCPPAVALNGGSVSAGWAVNDFDPEEVEALEIYREGTNLPIEYSFAGKAACGLVVIWLKSYARPSQVP
ncbi:MAG: carboxypeptidase regulatory-like domain-containing protein [Gemmatimonadetes bacterium]|nr:carboxypeptidase regulatory-like domain-containing protein [Gemmatimonadota bacterium]